MMHEENFLHLVALFLLVLLSLIKSFTIPFPFEVQLPPWFPDLLITNLILAPVLHNLNVGIS